MKYVALRTKALQRPKSLKALLQRSSGSCQEKRTIFRSTKIPHYWAICRR